MPLVSKFERLNHDAMHRWHDTCGMGEVADYIPFWPSERETNVCAPAPAWCTWMPGSQYVVECQPMTEQQRIYCQTQEFGPAMTPEMRERALQQGSQSEKSYLEILKREDPVKYEAYSDYERRAKCIEAGTSPFWCDYGTQIFWASIAAVGALILVKR